MGSALEQASPGPWPPNAQKSRRRPVFISTITALLLFVVAVYWNILPFEIPGTATKDYLISETQQKPTAVAAPNNHNEGLASHPVEAVPIGLPLSTAVVQASTSASSTTSWRILPTLDPAIDEHPPLLPNVLDPAAINAQKACPGYTASFMRHAPGGFSAILTLAGAPCNVYGTDVESLNLTVQYQTVERLFVKITPTYLSSANITQYYIPDYYVREPEGVSDAYANEHSDLQLTWSNEPTFSFTVRRVSTNDIIFSTVGTTLVFEDQFVEFKSALPENYNLYGLGERLHDLRLGNDFVATIYSADAGNPPDWNIYGSHPFYMDTRYYKTDSSTGELTLVTDLTYSAEDEYVTYSHGVYLRNTHGQEIILKPDGITWRMIGGGIDLYFFSGPSQTELTKQYVNVVGLPALQQYYAFGYHQCRWGYDSWGAMKEIVDDMRKFGIPMESIWTDLDYMYQYRDFENDPDRYSYEEGEKFLGELHKNHQHWIPIVDSAIYIPNPNNESDAYPTYTRGNASGAFMSNTLGLQYIGAVWPGYTVFPDWRSQGTQGWWTNEIKLWHDKVGFSGIWIDMSEVASFCIGSCGSGKVTENPVHPPFRLPGEEDAMSYDYPTGFEITNASEYASAIAAGAAQASRISATALVPQATTAYLRTTPTPGVRNVTYPPYVLKHVNKALGAHAMSPDARHADGSEDYDIHNLFGHEIMNATYNALLEVFPGKRPFIIARSNFAGSGSFAGHWGGDNNAEWSQMTLSIPQALTLSMLGIPMFGADTCGFSGNTDEELCNRWMQLSAFFTFYRNHNIIAAIPQEPYRWSSVTEASKKAMHIRYSILPYIYTLFYHAHLTGSTVMRALAWEFPTDPTLARADRQFLLGPAIMVTPVLEPLALAVHGVFPGKTTKWYDWYTGEAVTASWTENVTIAAPLGHIPVYIRGGYVIPMQAPGYTTVECRQNDWSLIVALDPSGKAAGDLYIDDGECVDQESTLYVEFSASDGSLSVTPEGDYDVSQPLTYVTVLGVQEEPKQVGFNDEPGLKWEYDGVAKLLNVTGLEEFTGEGAWKGAWRLTWE